MSRKALLAALATSSLILAVSVSAQTLTGSSTVLISATVPDLTGSPAQVLIPSMASVTMPNMSANVTITNEGDHDYEYFYEWCVTTDPNDSCGSGNNAFYASASKLIAADQDWNTVLTATVFSPGTYYFKTTAYFGSNASSASRQFTTTSSSVSTGSNGGSTGSTSGTSGSSGASGGSSGVSGSSLPPAAIVPTPTNPIVPVIPTASALRGDFNNRGSVDASDFSILLSYWGKKPPFKNPAVDLNNDGKINSVDFSILLYLWGTKTKGR
jgi:hypothetical protein